MMNKTKALIILTLMLMSLAFTANAKEMNPNDYFTVQFGQDSMEMIEKQPDLKPVAADLQRKDGSMLYTLKPQTVYGMETVMTAYTFDNGKLYKSAMSFKDTSREGADKLLKEMLKYNGKTKPVFNADGKAITFIAYKWENKTVGTFYVYYYSKVTGAGSLQVETVYKPLNPQKAKK